jgi:hypothetical protein
MSDAEQNMLERYYVYHKRAMGLTLLMVAGMAIYNVVQVIGTGDRTPLAGLTGATLILIIYIVSLLTVQLVTLHGRAWRVRDPQAQVILQDEWTQTNLSRARQTAFWTMLLAQWPMMFFMAYVPPEPSVVGMGILTVTLGIGAYFASYLYFSRQRSDG